MAAIERRSPNEEQLSRPSIVGSPLVEGEVRQWSRPSRPNSRKGHTVPSPRPDAGTGESFAAADVGDTESQGQLLLTMSRLKRHRGGARGPQALSAGCFKENCAMGLMEGTGQPPSEYGWRGIHGVFVRGDCSQLPVSSLGQENDAHFRRSTIPLRHRE